ncbi:uncharacterized protein UTRI_05360_B [Ustilago trichophora]|uniref:Uncharacterized protein n=1 Tax=Ustilago trichophora TaxID=86804 RepID=A0A5C3EK31_9BASI|nr:uncharacterized protein UTRI_05360_B [Ustilago trichophora]
MPRWRSSLALLDHIDIRSQGSSSASQLLRPCRLPTSLPDFLAPSLSHVPSHTRRHKASYVRAALQASAFGTSTSSAGPSKSVQKPTFSQNVDFSSYFDSDLPIKASDVASTSALSSSSLDAEIAQIEAIIDAANTKAEIHAAVEQLRYRASLQDERRRIRQSRRQGSRAEDQHAPTLDLNERFLLCLFKQSYAITRRSTRKDFSHTDSFVAKSLRKIFNDIPADGFSTLFLARLAAKAGAESANLVLDQLFDIVKVRLVHSPPSPSLSTRTESAATTNATFENNGALSLSRVLLSLMRGFSNSSSFKRVQDCFTLLKNHSLPANVFHYQLQLIALFRERVSQFITNRHVDMERQSQEMQSDILEMKASMEANNVTLDDTFLATVVSGLSAPLRAPLSKASSISQAKSALQLVRTISRLFTRDARDKSFRNMPRLLSALIHAEIDAIERCSASRSNALQQSRKRIRTLIHQLDSATSLSQGAVYGRLDKKMIGESQLAAIFLELRLFVALGDIEAGLKKLRLLLSIEPLMEPEAAEQCRELILQQRSSVISLFSVSIQQRQGIKEKDAAYEVLDRAFSTQWFDSVWTGSYMPANPPPGSDLKAYDADATVLRLWKRWMHAWSADVLVESKQRIANDDIDHQFVTLANLDNDVHGAQEKLSKYHTFTGTYPWQTLKRGLQLLNKTIDQYELIHGANATVPGSTTDAGAHVFSDISSEPDLKPASPIAQLSVLFNERAVLDTIVKYTLRGGRPARNETMSTHVQRRLTLLIRTLARVRVPARTWENCESSMLRHLALIDREVLPTDMVRPAMDEILQRKRIALLRNRDLRRAMEEEAAKLEGHQMTLPRETGSVFVLRQILETRARMKNQQNLPQVDAPRPAFT